MKNTLTVNNRTYALETSSNEAGLYLYVRCNDAAYQHRLDVYNDSMPGNYINEENKNRMQIGFISHFDGDKSESNIENLFKLAVRNIEMSIITDALEIEEFNEED